ncbi:cGMP-dependent protein kinase 1 isoform X2 [Sitodiplosis mosellana]|uniref:cGMP-dependent protein kinase 1 isoform X2 n=1 Tax=Sitodiplosis mosellana TaxID=263140 RepID=UPI002444DB73|nr:cGMP-dependent protein kinase 1 isoform X2 [Sitodiplosis mosellana]
MSCFSKFFKIHKSFDLPVLNSVPGVVSKKNTEFDLDTIDSDKISQKSRKSKYTRNGSIPNNRISPRGSQVTMDSSRMSQISEKKEPPPHHNFEYDKILETTALELPDSLSMKCVPKQTLDDSYYDDEYPQILEASASSQSDESDRQKADSGIETDEIEEAHKSVSFSENVQILGEIKVNGEKTQKSQNGADTSHSNSSVIDSNSVGGESNNDSLTNLDDTSEALNEQNEPRPRMKREGVIADSIDQKSTRDFDLDLKVYEKSEETEHLIKSAIMSNDFLANMMDEERLQALVNAMIPQVLKANSYVIKEGETGNQFFVSAEGEYEVIKEGVCIKTFGPGIVFGELAILYKARRFASIKVTRDAFVWALDRKIFQKIMMKTGSQEREQNMKFLSSVRVLQGVSDNVLHKIGDLLKREFYATGSTIIRQGDQGDKFYIIRGGSVTVTKRMDDGVRIVGMLKRGDYFGEQALINKARRMASIIVNDPGTECLTLDRSAFTKYLGTIEELKQKPVDQIPDEESIIIPTPKTNVISPLYDHIQLSDLEIIGTLGVGGFGRVELVQYDKKETFALKILKKVDVATQGQIEHAYSEKDIMSSCDSSFIVKLHKTYRNRKYLYFLMECCLGGDVWTQLQKTKFFDEKTSKFVAACVVEAFDYLHTRGIIYRDLKPENLMIDADGYVKLVDFGFAKRVGPNCKTWTFAGTPEYVAPEIILNKGHDRAVDYWALGVFIHELLVGKPPFRGKDHMKTYNLILRGIDVVTFAQKIPKSAQHLIKGLCRQTPTDRLGYQKKGIAEIKKHAWFEGFQWDKLEDRTLTAPLKRPIKNNIDLSNFDEYPRDRDEPPDDISGWDAYF